ncbi:Fibronectin type III domain-containing protein [Paenibacillus sp. yr247]|uniref:FIMAH domain-containing protein n=1 Tax=Paenibacillus sp. yr247 TaxID=1761880 RepID=UPI00087FC73B|nr:carbohydrate-binding protein [Paenibacillus sp. yr247]SDO22637.1 Fibronectin type III domain-containing protein [Paenibacillus sp. yr247]
MLKTSSTKTYKWMALVLAMLVICTPVLSIPFKTFAATATSYYVDGTNGNDANDGLTIGAALKTIQAAATVAQSGDTVYVRAGVYREKVTPANSGVTIKNYNSESVTVSGADLITGWTLDTTLATGKNIYVADMNWDIYNGDGNIVFADGVLMKEATFPNIAVADLLDKTKYNTVKTFTYGPPSSIVDASGLGTNFPANTLNSGMLWVRTGNGYGSYTAAITGNPTTSTININWPLPSTGYNPDNTSYYYITRNKAVLDVETEWYKDVANGKLYFIAPGNVNPSTIMVEAKKRDYAFDLTGKTNITIDGIKLRAANLNFVNSSYNMVKNTLVDAPDYNLPAGMANLNGLTLGLNLNGDHNTIRDSEIRNMYGPGILVDGHDNSIINNYIHNVDFLHSYADAVKLNGYNHLVSHNTLTMSGRGLVGGSFSRSVIEYNDISQGMKLSKDGGAFYVVNVDMENTEIHHNVVHDIIGAGGSHGIYPDNSVHNVIFYDNITYNTSANGMLINVPNEYQLFYNNSIQGPIGQFCNNFDVCDSIGSKFTNNIVSGAFGGGANNNDMTKDKNIISAGTTHWTAPYSVTNPTPTIPSAYTLKSTSTGLDQGAVIPGITDGYVGNKPEIGAVETGGAPWKVGHDFANPPNPTFHLNPNIPYENQMKNAGFERGSFEEWTITAGTPSLFKQAAWDYKASSMVRFQNYAVRLKAGDTIQQTVNGLKPNTTYTLNAWGIIQGTVFQAEDYNASSGTFSQTPFRGENCLCGNTAGAWVKYNSIDFGTGLYNSINFGAVSRVTGGKIDVKLDIPTNPSIATYTINSTNDVINNGAWNYNKTDTPITTSVTGVHDVYLVFSNANEIYLDNFRLSNTTANVDQAILGVKDFGGTETTTTITDKTFNSTTKAKSVEFTTGPNNTSATIYASKPNGNYYAFVDGFGVAEKVPVPAPFSGSYNGTVANFTWPAVSNAVSYDVYRSNIKDGPYTTTVCSEVTTLSCSDSTGVELGKSYYYIMKSRSATGALSINSVEVTIYVPYKLSTDPYQSMQPFDSFENGLSNWVSMPGKGTPSLSSAQVHSGSSSYMINEDMDTIYQIFNTSYNKVVSMWFYDTASATNMQNVAFVDDSVTARGIGVNTPTSATKYVYRTGGTHVATGVARTTGWHEFKWDYTSGTKVDMYIDNVKIASLTGAANFNRIVMGDQWSGNTVTAYYDDISIMDLPAAPTQSNIEAGNGKLTLNWSSTSGATGYKVKYGTASGVYTSTVDVGNVSSTTIEGLQNGTTYYFAISAYNSAGQSRNSNEVIGTPDGTAPSTQAVLDGSKGSGNWFTSDVTVTLQSQDDNAGVASSEYSLTVLQSVYGLQSTNGFVPYTSPLLLSDGIYELQYRSTDRAGNVEASKTITVNVDKTAPTTVLTVNGSPLVDGAAFLDSQLLNLLVQSEDQLSGLATQTILIDGVLATSAQNSLNWAGQLGIHFIQVVATDLAGNVTISEINVKVATNESSMQELMKRYVATGEVNGSLEAQITNKFSQSLDHYSKGHMDQAIKHMQDVLKDLEKAKQGDISAYVKQVLTADANAIIAVWSR